MTDHLPSLSSSEIVEDAGDKESFLGLSPSSASSLLLSAAITLVAEQHKCGSNTIEKIRFSAEKLKLPMYLAQERDWE